MEDYLLVSIDDASGNMLRRERKESTEGKTGEVWLCGLEMLPLENGFSSATQPAAGSPGSSG